MSAVTVRPFQEGDLEGFSSVMSLTYNNGMPFVADSAWRSNRELHVAEANGQIVGAFHALLMTASLRGSVVGCGGLGAVGVSPDARRLGVGNAMMRYYIARARETGTPMASLYAFREPFYRKSGYEVCGKRLGISCPTHRLPVTSDSLPVRRLTPDEYRLIEPCYREFALARNGANMREAEWQWKRVLAEHKPLTIYGFGDPIEAYVAVNHNSGFWEEQGISEFVWTTRAGYESGISFFRQLGINKNSIAWNEPSDSPFYAKYLDNSVSAQVARPTMFRVTDVPAVLRAVKTEESGEFRIAVEDDTIAENRGPWLVQYSKDGVSVTPCDEADLAIDIRRFVQAMLGEPCLADLARNGLVNVENPDGLRAAIRFLPPMPTVCLDFF